MLTIAEFAALPEDDQHRWELQAGELVEVPRLPAQHLRAIGRLFAQLEPQLPPGQAAIPSVDIDLDLVPPDRPGHARRPDLIVVNAETVDRAEYERRLIRASEVMLVVDIVSPGLVRIVRQYAEAGIKHYWAIELGKLR